MFSSTRMQECFTGGVGDKRSGKTLETRGHPQFFFLKKNTDGRMPWRAASAMKLAMVIPRTSNINGMVGSGSESTVVDNFREERHTL